uniref:MFSD2 lysolipid transporter B, sphingolipid n=1 Tax=Cavia porcellus TaxID=10141 RepID=H0W9Q6_CAVPO
MCYGFGGIPNQVATSATSFYLQLFLLDVAQIPAAQVSLVLFGGKVSGAVADPVAGFFINRSRRTGSAQLMPWVLGCTPFLSLAYFFLWFLPPFSSLRGLWYTTFSCLFQALATFLQVPYTALTMLLTSSPKERDSATAYRMTMEMVGTLMGATVHGLIVSGAHRSNHCELPGPAAVSPDAGRLYSIAAAVVAATYPVCVSLLCLGVREQPGPADPGPGHGLGFLTGLGLTTRHPPYVKLVVSFLFISAAVQVEQSYLVLFCTHAAQLREHVQGLVLTVLVSAVLSTPLWEWVLQRFGKRPSALGICVHASRRGGRLPAAEQAPRPRPGDHLLFLLRLLHQALKRVRPWASPTLSLEFAGYKVEACKQAAEVVVALKVLIGAVPTCLILVGLCVLMVGPAPSGQEPDTARQHRLHRKSSLSLVSDSRGLL